MRTLAIVALALAIAAGAAEAANLSHWNGISISGLSSLNGFSPAAWNGLTISYSSPVAGSKRVIEDSASVRDLENGTDRKIEGGATQDGRLIENGDDRLLEDQGYRLLQY
jgi:hypothetical protein